MINVNELDRNQNPYCESWERVKEKSRDGKMHYWQTTKRKVEAKLHEIVSKFYTMLILYMSHIGRKRHQNAFMKEIKNKLTEDALVYIDFIENYACKYGSEIQTVHFGGNRSQVSLHTSVLYSRALQKSFCTISQDLQHDPVAIFMHLKPILKNYKNIKNIHFSSDSPSSQY